MPLHPPTTCLDVRLCRTSVIRVHVMRVVLHDIVYCVKIFCARKLTVILFNMSLYIKIDRFHRKIRVRSLYDNRMMVAWLGSWRVYNQTLAAPLYLSAWRSYWRVISTPIQHFLVSLSIFNTFIKDYCSVISELRRLICESRYGQLLRVLNYLWAHGQEPLRISQQFTQLWIRPKVSPISCPTRGQ